MTSVLHPNFEYTTSHISNLTEKGVKENTNSPEVPDDLVLFGVASVIRVLFPVFDVNVSDTANKQFQFSLIKNVDEIWRNKLVEASDKSVKLLLDTFLNSPFSDETWSDQQSYQKYWR